MISDGPKYSIFLYAELGKPACHFSCKNFDFGKCIVDAPDNTYKKNIAFKNDEKADILTLDFTYKHYPELFVDFQQERVPPDCRLKIPIQFRPKQVKMYEFKLQFWVNSLCEEILIIRGEGVPLLVDLYEGCQKSFDLGPVKIGKKIVREIEVMNHSKVPIDASFIFEDMHPKIDPGGDMSSLGSSICLHPDTPNIPTDQISRVKQVQMYRGEQSREQIEKDVKNALASVKVVPSRCIIKPYMKLPLKIHFKPVGLISSLNVQLNAKVLDKIKPLVLLSGSATGMLLYFSQNSLQFGRVRKRGCKILKVMLNNKGDFGTRFFWQPLKSDEFTINPMQGYIDARTNVTFTITYRPKNYNPFVKLWASCNIENYKPQELSLYATCMDNEVPQNISMFLECPVRSVTTDYMTVNNPTDEAWLVLSEVSGGPFETLKEFVVDPDTMFNIPIHFKPRTMGKHETQVLYSPLGETALFITVVGAAMHPNPSGDLTIKVPAKETHSESLSVFNITEKRETYIVNTEVVKVIPDKFDGFYEIKYPDYVQVWGEAAGKCLWQFTCYQPCEMQMKVMFINQESQEYQFYNITAIVTPSQIMGTLSFVSRARESVQQEIMLDNPLDVDDDFYIKCDKLECVDVVHINRHSNAKLIMTYSPLAVGMAEDYLEIHNDLIGVYMYKIKLSCLPAKEKCLEFTTTLGNRIPIRLRVQNRSDTRADFECTVSHPCIQMDKDYTLQPGEKGKFLVWFEPIDLGVQNCRVSFNSNIAGEFVFNIKGKAHNPTPQGPYHIKLGGTTQIKFKNVFEDTHKFKMFVDHEDFYVKYPIEQIKPKKDIKVAVYLSDRINREDPPTGSLTIENLEPAEPRVQWTYFLHGKP